MPRHTSWPARNTPARSAQREVSGQSRESSPLLNDNTSSNRAFRAHTQREGAGRPVLLARFSLRWRDDLRTLNIARECRNGKGGSLRPYLAFLAFHSCAKRCASAIWAEASPYYSAPRCHFSFSARSFMSLRVACAPIFPCLADLRNHFSVSAES